MTAGLLDHLWQSSLVAGGIALLTLFFRRNGAAVRFWLWFAASLKFLLPFALLATLGDTLSQEFPAALPTSLLAIQPAAEKLSAPAQLLAMPKAEGLLLEPLLLGAWCLGFAAIAASRLLRWFRLRAVMAQAQDASASNSAPVPIKTSLSLLEPGLVGIVAPMVLLPQELMARLSPAERASILAHELSHLARRDNLTATVHMLVEALFWFYPPVWLIGTRLIAEREQACDEAVLAVGHDPEVYAGGILKVCKFCIRSPLPCASGASGADLKHRLRRIMCDEAVMDLGAFQRLLLAGAAAAALALPVMGGFRNTPLPVAIKQVIDVPARAEQAVTAVVEEIGRAAPIRHVTMKTLPQVKMAAILPPLPVPETVPPATLPDVPVPPAGAEPTPAQTVAPPPPAAPAAKEVLMALNPTGQGDPDAVTCRLPQLLPGSRLAGPTVCKTNRVWAELRANRQDIGPDGTMIVTLNDFQRQRARASNCRETFFGRPGVNSLAGPSTTFCF